MKTAKIKLKMFFFKLHFLFIYLAFRTRVRYASKEVRREVKKSKTPFLIAYNHVGFFDATLLLTVFYSKFLRLVASKEIAKNRFCKFFFSWNGVILITRGSMKLSDYSTIVRSVKAGFWVGIAPEGHINRGDDIHELHSGAAQFSLVTGAPILPVYIVPNRKVPWRRQLVYIGKPLPSEGDKHTLTDRLTAALLQLKALHKSKSRKKGSKCDSDITAVNNDSTTSDITIANCNDVNNNNDTSDITAVNNNNDSSDITAVNNNNDSSDIINVNNNNDTSDITIATNDSTTSDITAANCNTNELSGN